MTLELKKLVELLDQELKPELFKDYCPNGLQVDASPTSNTRINKLVTGVTACQALIERAIKSNADAILVHHGYFWRGENTVITGMKRRRIQTLLENGISLIAYHLPLDAHATLGNNVELARLMGWEVYGGLVPEDMRPIGNWGKTAKPVPVIELSAALERELGRKPLTITGGTHAIKTLAWCTGAAQNMIDQALKLNVDAFVSGEISESTVHFARENNIHYLSIGHHASERYGVQALGRWLAHQTGLEHEFIDIDSPV